MQISNRSKFLFFTSNCVLTLIAILLMIPMIWMALCAFTPQSELQRNIPMQGAIQAVSSKTLTDWKEFRSWGRTYLTTENFATPNGKDGLFDITSMPSDEFENAPIHGWAFQMTRAMGLSTPPEPAERTPAGRLILWFENTLFICVIVTFLSVLLNAMAGYAFAKLPFPGSKWIFWMILGTIMIPGQVTLIPLFLMVTQGLHLGNGFTAVIVPMIAAPIGIFLMRQYIQGLPGTLEDAARIDGCSEIGIFFRVIVPLSKPILAVWAIFTFIGTWKAFLWPLVVTNNQDLYMLEVGLKTLQFSAGPRNVGVVMGAALLASIPMIIMFFLFQKHLTKGLTVGAVKG